MTWIKLIIIMVVVRPNVPEQPAMVPKKRGRSPKDEPRPPKKYFSKNMKQALVLAAAIMSGIQPITALVVATCNCTQPKFLGAANISLSDSCDVPPMLAQYSTVQYEMYEHRNESILFDG